MTREEQKAFVIGCLDSTKRALLEKIDSIPAEWDGHELRLWIERDVADQIGRISLLKKQPRGKRAKDFEIALLKL